MLEPEIGALQLREQRRRLRRRADLIALPVEQAKLQIVLEIPDEPADGGLRDAEHLGP